MPQPPQWFSSRVVSTQAPPHSVRPARQASPESMQAPSVQTDPGPHTIPHPPQLPASTRMSVQLPPQTISPAGH